MNAWVLRRTHRKGKGTKERGHETGRVTGRLVFDRRSGVGGVAVTVKLALRHLNLTCALSFRSVSVCSY